MSVSSDEGEGERGGGVELPGTGPAVGVRGGGVECAGGSRPCIGADAAQEFDFRILGADGNASGNECSAGNGKLTDPACISFNRSPHTRSTQPSTRRQTRFRLIGTADGTQGDGSYDVRAFGCLDFRHQRRRPSRSRCILWGFPYGIPRRRGRSRSATERPAPAFSAWDAGE